ncbi:MAG: glutamate racemase [Opitutales bacterium]
MKLPRHLWRLGALGLLWIALTLPAPAEDAVAHVVAYARAHPAGDVPASFRADDYRGDLRDLPIGVFDSGIGGLTVLEAIKSYDAHNNRTGADGPDGIPDFANERFIYLGDQANMPYGNYPAAGRLDFLRELVLRDLLFLLGRNYARITPQGLATRSDKPPVKAIVIACNTATAVGLADVRQALKTWGVPIYVIGVIEAGAHATVTDGHTGGIAVFSTVATCASEAYPRAIHQAEEEKHLPVRPVYQQGSPTLAAAIEGDPAIHQAPGEIVRSEFKEFLAKYRATGGRGPIDTLVLGCTHYPLVRQEFSQVWAEEAGRQTGAAPGLLATQVTIIDPAERTASELWRLLTGQKLWSTKTAAPADRYFITVANPRAPGIRLDAEGGLAAAYKYSRAPGQPEREDTAVVPMEANMLPSTGAALIRDHLPLTWAGIQHQWEIPGGPAGVINPPPDRAATR